MRKLITLSVALLFVVGGVASAQALSLSLPEENNNEYEEERDCPIGKFCFCFSKVYEEPTLVTEENGDYGETVCVHDVESLMEALAAVVAEEAECGSCRFDNDKIAAVEEKSDDDYMCNPVELCFCELAATEANGDSEYEAPAEDTTVCTTDRKEIARLVDGVCEGRVLPGECETPVPPPPPPNNGGGDNAGGGQEVLTPLNDVSGSGCSLSHRTDTQVASLALLLGLPLGLSLWFRRRRLMTRRF